MAVRQVAAEFGDGGVVVGQLLLDRQRLAVLGLRLRRLARLSQQFAEVVVADRQTTAEFGDGGVVVGQLLLDRQRLAVLGLRLCRLARGHQQDAEVVVAVRQCRLPVVVLRVRRGEGRLEVAGLLHRTQGLGRAADGPEEPARRIAGVGEGRPGRRVLRRAAVGGRQRRPRSLEGRQRLLGFARVFQGPADRHEAACHVDRRRPVRPPAVLPAPRGPPAPASAAPGRLPCGQPDSPGGPPRSSPSTAPAARASRCRPSAGRRASRRSRPPNSTTDHAGP